MSFDADGNIASISLADPLKALELLAKHYELLGQKSDQKDGKAAFVEFFESLAEKQRELGAYP